MTLHANNIPGNKTNAVAHSGSRRQGNIQAVSPFTGTKPEATTQKKLQNMADSSRQVKQLHAYQLMANNFRARETDNNAMPVQRVIAAAPQAVNQAGMLAAGGVQMDMGNTNPIANEVLPTYNIVTAANGLGGFDATVVKTANAYEGDSDAVYLQRGIYPSGLMLNAGVLGPFAAGPGNRQVYADLSAANSNLSRMAEQEHLDDLRRAFQITLGVADGAYDDAVANGPYAGATAPLAQTAAETGINNFIAARAAILGTAPFTIATNLAALYQAKQALTNTGRDGIGLHTFDIDRVNTSNSPLAWAMYLVSLLPGVEKKDFREVIPGPNFQVPGPATNALVV